MFALIRDAWFWNINEEAHSSFPPGLCILGVKITKNKISSNSSSFIRGKDTELHALGKNSNFSVSISNVDSFNGKLEFNVIKEHMQQFFLLHKYI